MDALTAIHARRSVRKFRPDPVGREDLKRIVAAAVDAPSGCNAQLRQYIVVDDPELMDKLRPYSHALESAPAAVVLLIDPKPTEFGEFWVQDASAAMENMLIAATALGYGSCWVEGAIRRHEKEIAKLLGVPEPLRVWSVMPVGKPEETPRRPTKPDLADVTHFNTFAQRDEG
ncbi:MAG: nitroreductase family protein [Phycisphaerae bacterium]